MAASQQGFKIRVFLLLNMSRILKNKTNKIKKDKTKENVMQKKKQKMRKGRKIELKKRKNIRENKKSNAVLYMYLSEWPPYLLEKTRK